MFNYGAGHTVDEVKEIDPGRACLKSACHSHCSLVVFGEDAGCQAVGSVVCEFDDFLFIFEFGNGHDGAEDFFFHDFHVGFHVGEDGRLEGRWLVDVDVDDEVQLTST